MSALRLCLPVLNVWTHIIQFLYITNCYLFMNVMHLNEIHLITRRAADNTENTSTLKSKVTASIAWVSIIIPNRSSTFKLQWSNSLARCYACQLYALLLRPRPLICNILWRHKNTYQERVWRQTENSLLVQYIDNQQSRSNLNFFFVITSIITTYNNHQNYWYWKFTCVFFSKGWGIKDRFSEHVMANISHSFNFYLLCNHCHTQSQQIKTNTVSKWC